MSKEHLDAGIPRAAEEQTLLRVKELDEEGVQKIVDAILEIERVNSSGESEKFEEHMSQAIGKSLGDYIDGDSCVISASFGGMRFLIVRDDDGLIKLILDEKYPKDVIKQAKKFGIGTMDADVAEAVRKQFKRERDQSVTFRIGEDSEDERERVVQAVLNIERELGGSAVDEGVIRKEVNSALSDYFESEEGTGFEGYGGWNRYQINADGSIALSKYHSTSECIKRAKELGFDRF